MRGAHVIIVLAAWPALAGAQLAYDVRLVSDNIYRGHSISGGRPSAQADLGWDGTDGWYAGASAQTVRLQDDDLRFLIYGGRALRIDQDLSAELGATASLLVRDGSYDYGEVYAGLAATRWSARASFSPRYFGSDARTLYLEVNGSVPLGVAAGGQVSAFAHAGSLIWLNSPNTYERSSHTSADGQFGVGWTRPAYSLQLYWAGAGHPRRTSTGVLSASYFF
jgi:uncharacterized protein (TIGR02001 family)